MPIPEGETRKRIGNSRSNHCNYFEHLVNEYPGIIVIILDEIDKTESPQMINNIIRTVSEKSDNAPCIIGITNDLKIH
jgi:Cdc6-like AAA superfamily ATPase